MTFNFPRIDYYKDIRVVLLILLNFYVLKYLFITVLLRKKSKYKLI